MNCYVLELIIFLCIDKILWPKAFYGRKRLFLAYVSREVCIYNHRLYMTEDYQHSSRIRKLQEQTVSKESKLEIRWANKPLKFAAMMCHLPDSPTNWKVFKYLSLRGTFVIQNTPVLKAYKVTFQHIFIEVITTLRWTQNCKRIYLCCYTYFQLWESKK